MAINVVNVAEEKMSKRYTMVWRRAGLCMPWQCQKGGRTSIIRGSAWLQKVAPVRKLRGNVTGIWLFEGIGSTRKWCAATIGHWQVRRLGISGKEPCLLAAKGFL